jgi:hypothetical protein
MHPNLCGGQSGFVVCLAPEALPGGRKAKSGRLPHMRRRSDSGFAMLLVFLMAAVVAIMLYREVPRIAFETQRQKEQLLVERGQQYKRAIQLFLRANNNQRWPANMDELQSFNGKRFLRRRYKDPMTGKDEWRLIHVQNGVLTDSVNNKPAGKPGDQNGKDALAGQTIGDYGNSVGSYNAGQGGGTLSAAQRRRSSDSPAPSGTPFPVTGTAGQGATSPDGTATTGQPASETATPPPGLPGLPGQGQTPGQTNATNAGGSQQGGSSVGSYSSVGNYGSFGSSPATGQQAGVPGVPGQLGNSANSGGTPGFPTGLGNSGGYPQPGMSGSPAQSGMYGNPAQSGAATSLINGLLTTPRPGGLAGINGQNNVIGGGIAGVASTVDSESIMVYNDHKNYSEWEFIFDPAKQHYPPPNPLSGATGTPASQLGSMPGGTTGTPASQMGTMPGSFGTQGTQGPQTSPTGTSPFGTIPADPDMRGGRQ